jgi:hypothetical protein
VAKGNTPRPIRFPDDTWEAAVAAFPADRGKPGGLSAEVQSFVAFLAEHPETWAAIKQTAADRGVDPWTLIPEAVAAYKP